MPQALVFLSIDEILDFARHPATVIDLETLQEAFDEPQLIVGIDDLKILRQPGLAPVPPQQAMGQAVKRADPEVIDGHTEQSLDAPAHLGSGLVRERNGQQALRCNSHDIDEPRGSMHEHARLAAAGARNDKHRLGGRRHGLTLRVVQGLEDR